MMLRVLLVVALAATALADHHQAGEHDCCSKEDRQEIQFMWKRIWDTAYTERRVTIAKAAFNDLLGRYPEARALFQRVEIDEDGPKYHAHLIRVMNGIDTLVSLMDDPTVMAEQLKHLITQHVARTGVKGDYFDAIIDSFERVLPQVSPCFNLEAFDRCFGRVAHKIAEKLP